jgi:hypothetical protein
MLANDTSKPFDLAKGASAKLEEYIAMNQQAMSSLKRNAPTNQSFDYASMPMTTSSAM